MFSDRSAIPTETNSIAEQVAGASGRLFDLTESNPTRARLPYPARRIVEALADVRSVEYTPHPFGLESARQGVAELWSARGIDVDASHVVMTSSTSEAYSFAFKLLCDPGDEVLVPEPSYPLFECLARFEGVRLKPYPLIYEGAWHVDIDALGRARSDKTRAAVVVSPNNPTGSYIKHGELAAIAALGLPIVSDEVFAEYSLVDDATRARSALEATDTLVLALDGLSKLCALPQMKLGWLTLGGPSGRVAEASRRLELIADAYLSPSTPVQLALPALLEAGRPVREAIRARIRSNLAALRDLTRGTALTPLFVEGGWYVVIRLPDIHSEEEWVLGLLKAAQVVVQPGFFYGFDDEPLIVVSLITPEDRFRAGLERLGLFVARG